MTPQQYADATRAVLDRWEGMARAATPGPWETAWWVEDLDTQHPRVSGPDMRSPDGRLYVGPDIAKMVLSEADAAHIAAHDPQRVLAQVEQYRRAVERDLRVLERHYKRASWATMCVCGDSSPCSDETDALDDLRGMHEALVGEAGTLTS